MLVRVAPLPLSFQPSETYAFYFINRPLWANISNPSLTNWPMEFVPCSTLSRDIVELRDNAIDQLIDYFFRMSSSSTSSSSSDSDDTIELFNSVMNSSDSVTDIDLNLTSSPSSASSSPSSSGSSSSSSSSSASSDASTYSFRCYVNTC